MGTTVSVSSVARIGETAGRVWQMLSDNGPTTMAKLAKAVGEPRDIVMQAVGWLAREGKIAIDDNHRTPMVSLCENGSP
jgi:hypothetical protein